MTILAMKPRCTASFRRILVPHVAPGVTFAYFVQAANWEFLHVSNDAEQPDSCIA